MIERSGRVGRRLALLVSILVLVVGGTGCAPRVCPRARTVDEPPSKPQVPIGSWVIPRSLKTRNTPEVIESVAGKRVVLLGEQHDRPEHHLWQLQTIAALQARRKAVVIGFEMFPRSAQSVLDRWVQGEVGEREFLEQTAWAEFWRVPSDLYMPLFRFARMNRVPMVALNVPRELVSKVALRGWESVPMEERFGLSAPAPPAAEYEKWLADWYEDHRGGPSPHVGSEEKAGEPGPVEESGAAGADEQTSPLPSTDEALPESPAAEPAHTADEPDLQGFIRAQLVWDRAFAEGIHAAVAARPDALIIGVIGEGHLRHGYGVPHQLAALGLNDVAVLLPWDDFHGKEELVPGVADAVFGTESVSEDVKARPMLGVLIEAHETGVAIKQVLPESIAETAGLRAGDIVIEAAGLSVKKPGDLQKVVMRQAPGTWLPLRVRRDARKFEIVARFPPES